MPPNPGRNTDSRPAVYNESSTGISPNDSGPLSDLQAGRESRSVLEQQSEGEQASDTRGNAIDQANPLQTDAPIRLGRVLLALPYIHCYKIQLNGRQGTCIATATSTHSHMPLGVRAGEVIPPNSTVLVWKPHTATLAYILCVIPTPTMDDDFNASTHIQQGGNSGPKKTKAYQHIVQSTDNAYGWVSQSAGRPMDGLIGEYSRLSETGIGLLIDSFQAYLRVNEACGLWLNYFDSYAKLSGLSLTLQSYCEHNYQLADEGENFSMKGYAIYPWEATGMYEIGERISKTNEAEAVQLDKKFPFALEDLEDQAQTPIYRLTDYTGYLGQGHNRTLMKPARTSGRRLLTDTDNDTGLFQELLALDGGYTVRSAKQVTIAKYPLIPNPRRIRQVEDALGDDLTVDNDYKFSGRFGEGDEHKVQEWDDTDVGELKSLMRPAGVLDLLAHHYNWKSTHPFEYHTKDYEYPEESEGSEFNSVQFHRGVMQASYVEVFPKALYIDSRYKHVNYYNTASFVSLTEDGSVLIGDGYGSQISMTGGQIRLEAGGDVMLMSGSRVVTLAREAIVRAQDSVDISSSNRDVRIKAEHNLQVLGGNSGFGGVLIESKSQGVSQIYDQRVGEEVGGSGVVLLSRSGNISSIAKTIYIRSGVDEGNAEGVGNIVLDCASGRSGFVSYARSHALYNSQGLGIWHQPTGQDDINIDKSHFFGPSFSKINGPTAVSGHVAIIDGGSLGVDGGIFARGNIIALQAMATADGKPPGDSLTNNIPEDVNKFIDDFETAGGVFDAAGEPYFKAFYTDFLWREHQPGNTELLEDQIGFSYRDNTHNGKSVYSYADDYFFLLETRWQQLERNQLVSGPGRTWTEKSVFYQGKELYPWPGKKHWVDRDAFLRYENQGGFLLFDQGGFSKSRKSNRTDYEEPAFADWQRDSCDAIYTL
jgi:hypothetical protein